jgi:hypothetical protein
MKHLLYLLLVVNLVYFSWNLLQGATTEDAMEVRLQLPPDTRRLMTLEELQEQRRQQRPADGSSTQPAGHALRPEGPDQEPAAAIEVITALQPPGAGVPLACYTIGPFLAEADLKAAMGRLEALEFIAELRTAEEQQQIGYWIYLPAMPRGEALEYKAKLDSHKDKEYFIGKDNVLSLGAFRDKGRAERRIRQLRKIGIEAVQEPRFKTRNVFWIDLVEGVSGSDRDRLAAGMGDVDVQPLQCR